MGDVFGVQLDAVVGPVKVVSLLGARDEALKQHLAINVWRRHCPLSSSQHKRDRVAGLSAFIPPLLSLSCVCLSSVDSETRRK